MGLINSWLILIGGVPPLQGKPSNLRFCRKQPGANPFLGAPILLNVLFKSDCFLPWMRGGAALHPGPMARLRGPSQKRRSSFGSPGAEIRRQWAKDVPPPALHVSEGKALPVQPVPGRPKCGSRSGGSTSGQSQIVYPKPCKESKGPICAPIFGWDYPLSFACWPLQTIFSGFL